MYTTYMKSITLDSRQLNDLELIMNGGFYPLTGFMTQNEYNNVLEKYELLDGTIFSLPINLYISQEVYTNIYFEKTILLKDEYGFSLCEFDIIDFYQPDLTKECLLAYNTTDTNHPYVNIVMQRKEMFYVGGNITKKYMLPKHYNFCNLRLSPNDTKEHFKKEKMDIIIGFQTRNPMHKSHFELTKYAINKLKTDNPDKKVGLLLHPTVGITQDCDIEYYTRVKCYKEIIKHYDNENILLALLPLSMRMAGPKEALLHAIIRKNYGCTHFIIGRDHASPSCTKKDDSHFYEKYDAQHFVMKYANKIGIEIIVCQNMCYDKIENKYIQEDKITDDLPNYGLISGTELRNMLKNNIEIPEWYTFKEIETILRKSIKPEGICFYFIGLSGSGKTTLANALAEKINELHLDKTITILDGDIIRTNLSKGLGFSKDDKNTNVKRIGYVASEIVKHGGICIVANIAPYEDARIVNRQLIQQYGKYIEIFVDTNITVCEQRDMKGLYKQAKEGKLLNFAGINDVFECPKQPTIVIDGNEEVITNVNKIYEFILRSI